MYRVSLQRGHNDGMENRVSFFEITVISAEDLRLDRRHVRKNAFVTIPNHATTSLDADGGSYPCWNEKFRVGLPPSASSISVEVHCKTASGVRTIGAAAIPISDFCGGVVPAGYLHFLSYRLRDRHGERNGIINLSIRMEVPEGRGGQRCGPMSINSSGIRRCEPAWVGDGSRSAGGVALGIPLSLAYGM